MRPMFTDFFVSNPPIWAAHPRIIAYICEVTPPAPSPQPPPLHPLKGHPNNSAILSIYGMHRYENFAQTMGKCWKGAPL